MNDIVHMEIYAQGVTSLSPNIQRLFWDLTILPTISQSSKPERLSRRSYRQPVIVMQAVEHRDGNDFPAVLLLLVQFRICVRCPVDALVKPPMIIPGHINL